MCFPNPTCQNSYMGKLRQTNTRSHDANEFALRLGRYRLSAIRRASGQGDGIDTRHFPVRVKLAMRKR